MCLLFDELGLYYNSFNKENIGLIMKEGKILVKLRKLFSLKSSYCNYVVNENKKISTKEMNRKLVLFYEIREVLEVIKNIIPSNQ